MKSIKNLIANPKEKILIKRIKIYIKKKKPKLFTEKINAITSKKKNVKTIYFEKKNDKKEK